MNNEEREERSHQILGRLTRGARNERIKEETGSEIYGLYQMFLVLTGMR
jgi:hypothetical protein